MELIVLLEDRTALKLTRELSGRVGMSSARTREGVLNPDAPACSTQFATEEFRRDWDSNPVSRFTRTTT